MSQIDEATLNGLQNLCVALHRLDAELTELSRSGLPPALEAENREEILGRLDKKRAQRRRYVEDIVTKRVTFPPQHDRHASKLEEFWKGGSYDESVFIMTKFPSGNGAAGDQELARVIAAVSNSLLQLGYKPRVASDIKYHPILWDNVELYLTACRRGVAIVEDRYLAELNPNVSMEWGWMRGMGKEVVYLVEKKFKHARADWNGLIEDEFDWDDPEQSIGASLTKSLGKYTKR